VYRDIAISQGVVRQATAQPSGRQDDEDTGVDDSCCGHRPVSAGDAMNVLAVLQEWLECNTAGESISFHLIAELENYTVSCHGLFQSTVLVSFVKL